MHVLWFLFAVIGFLLHLVGGLLIDAVVLAAFIGLLGFGGYKALTHTPRKELGP